MRIAHIKYFIFRELFFSRIRIISARPMYNFTDLKITHYHHVHKFRMGGIVGMEMWIGTLNCVVVEKVDNRNRVFISVNKHKCDYICYIIRCVFSHSVVHSNGFDVSSQVKLEHTN